jgi:hypothetical protein
MPDSNEFHRMRDSRYEKPIQWLLARIERFPYTAAIPRRITVEMVLAIIPNGERFCSAPINDTHRVYGFESPHSRDICVEWFSGSVKIVI